MAKKYFYILKIHKSNNSIKSLNIPEAIFATGTWSQNIYKIPRFRNLTVVYNQFSTNYLCYYLTFNIH
jgi:hypothetical protein